MSHEETTLHRLAHLTHGTVVVTTRPWDGQLKTHYEIRALAGIETVMASASDLAVALAECERMVVARMLR